MSTTYTWLPARARRSLRERARFFTHTEAAKELAHELGVGASHSLDLLQTMASLRALVKSTPTVLIDVGAHKGDFARLAMDLFHFRRAICCEPDADLIPIIKARFTPNEAAVRCIAIADQPGEMEFFVHADRSMNSLVPADVEVLRSKFPTYDASATFSRRVPVETLDSLLSDAFTNPEDRFLIKIDTQGNEMNVLQGAEATLRQTDTCLIEFMFCTPYERRGSFQDMVNFMAGHGFECAGALDIKRRPTYEVSGVDFLFTRI